MCLSLFAIFTLESVLTMTKYYQLMTFKVQRLLLMRNMWGKHLMASVL